MFTFKHFCLAAVVTALPATAMADISYKSEAKRS